jgi:hypothetical protein
MLQPCVHMLRFLFALMLSLRSRSRTRADAALEILALRQQVTVLKRKHPRPPQSACDLVFLDHSPLLLASLVRCPPDCQTGNRHRMAPRRLSSLLALEIAVGWLSTEDCPRSKGLDRASGLSAGAPPFHTSQQRPVRHAPTVPLVVTANQCCFIGYGAQCFAESGFRLSIRAIRNSDGWSRFPDM